MSDLARSSSIAPICLRAGYCSHIFHFLSTRAMLASIVLRQIVKHEACCITSPAATACNLAAPQRSARCWAKVNATRRRRLSVLCRAVRMFCGAQVTATSRCVASVSVSIHVIPHANINGPDDQPRASLEEQKSRAKRGPAETRPQGALTDCLQMTGFTFRPARPQIHRRLTRRLIEGVM